jgi:hypothetical protein
MRCWGLWHYNDCDDVLRPAYGGAGASAGSSAQELTAEAFEKLLSDTLRPAQEGIPCDDHRNPKETRFSGAFYGYVWIL